MDDAQFKITYIERICNERDDLNQYFKDLNNNFISENLILLDTELDAKEAIKSHIKKNIQNTYQIHKNQDILMLILII